MKINNFKISPVLLFIAVTMFGCKKDNDIRISRLEGTWSIPGQSSDVKYTFNNTDKIVSILSKSSSKGADTIINRNFIISYDQRLITIYKEIYYHKENEIFTGQFNIVKLSKTEMNWKNTNKEAGEQEKKFIKN